MCVWGGVEKKREREMACTFSFLNQSPDLGGNSIAALTGKLFS